MALDSSELDLDSFEALLTEIDDQDPLADRYYVVEDGGSLADRIGPEAARAYMEEHSVSYMTRIGAARRLGKLHRHSRSL